MSRTRHHRGQKRRHNGHDLWGKGPGAGECYTAENKKLARQKVRSQRHKAISEELFNIERMDKALAAPRVTMPKGMTKEELMDWMVRAREDIDAGTMKALSKA